MSCQRMENNLAFILVCSSYVQRDLNLDGRGWYDFTTLVWYVRTPDDMDNTNFSTWKWQNSEQGPALMFVCLGRYMYLVLTT